MARRAYVFGILSPIVGEPPLPTDHFRLCFSAMVWDEGQAPSFETFNDCASGNSTIEIVFDDDANDIRRKIVDKIVAAYGVAKNNVVVLVP